MIDVYGLFWLDSTHLVLIAGSTGIVALYFLWRVFARLRLAWIVENTPTSLVRSAAQGQVELVGQVFPFEGRPLRAPLTGNPCLWYRYRIEKYQRRGKNSQWKEVEKGVSEQAFELRDATGSCLIDPRGADVHPRLRKRWEGNRRHPLSGDSPGLLSRLVFGERYRYTEELFVAEDICYALGWFETRGGGRHLPALEQMTADVVREWKADYPALLARFDSSGSGQLDESVWSRVREAAAEEAAQRRRVLAGEADQHWLQRPSQRGLPFLLSDHHEDDLSRQLRRQSGLAAAGLLVCSLVSGGLWLALLNA